MGCFPGEIDNRMYVGDAVKSITLQEFVKKVWRNLKRMKFLEKFWRNSQKHAEGTSESMLKEFQKTFMGNS